jgi:sugar phosphate isomerase/epimerase
VIEDVGTGNLGINLDPANLLMYGKANPVDALDIIGKYVRSVHAKDGEYPVDSRNLGAEKPIGQGRVNFPALIAKLKETGFDGSIIIEREIPEGPEQDKDILNAKAFLEKLIV